MSIYDQINLTNTGSDISLTSGEEGGDIEITSSGDFKLVSGTELIKQALARRFYTGLSQIGVVNLDKNGLYYQDYDYGSELYKTLSEPVSHVLLEEIKTLTKDFLDQEKRIIALDIRTFVTANQVSIEVDYRIVDSGLTDTVLLAYNPALPSGI